MTSLMVNLSRREPNSPSNVQNDSSYSRADQAQESIKNNSDPPTPIWVARKAAITSVLQEMMSTLPWNDKYLRTVIDVGDGNVEFDGYLSKIPGLDKIIFLGKDEELVASRCSNGLYHPPEAGCKKPLRVEAYAGHINEVDHLFVKIARPVFALIAVDLLKYLDFKSPNAFVKNVFAIIRPQVVIVSLPNSYFSPNTNQPRSSLTVASLQKVDRKAEWSKEEFENWCYRICKIYPNYSYTTEGIGAKAHSKQGSTLHMGIFRRSNMDFDLEMGFDYVGLSGRVNPEYWLLAEVSCRRPFDSSQLNRTIVNEFSFFVANCLMAAGNIKDYISRGLSQVKYPLGEILTFAGIPCDVTLGQIRSALTRANYKVVDIGKEIYVVLPVPKMEFEPSAPPDSEEDIPRLENPEAQRDDGSMHM